MREEMAALGLDPEAIDVREVRTDADAEREEFVGLADDPGRRARRPAAARRAVGLTLPRLPAA